MFIRHLFSVLATAVLALGFIAGFVIAGEAPQCVQVAASGWPVRLSRRLRRLVLRERLFVLRPVDPVLR